MGNREWRVYRLWRLVFFWCWYFRRLLRCLLMRVHDAAAQEKKAESKRLMHESVFEVPGAG